MSYEICKSIKIDEKNNVLKITHSSNNVYPKDWYTSDLWKEKTFFDKMKTLLDCLLQGDIVISSINDSTINVFYAYLIISQKQVISKWSDNGVSEDYKKQLEELTPLFISLIKVYNKDMYVFKNGYCYISGLSNYDYRYGGYKYIKYSNENYALKMSYKKAYIVEHLIAKKCGYEKIQVA
jgi:hypothetical protein